MCMCVCVLQHGCAAREPVCAAAAAGGLVAGHGVAAAEWMINVCVHCELFDGCASAAAAAFVAAGRLHSTAQHVHVGVFKALQH